jgi:hypothetical protein
MELISLYLSDDYEGSGMDKVLWQNQRLFAQTVKQK